MPDIDELVIQISSDSKKAVSGIDALATSLGKLKSATSGGLGLKSVAKGLDAVNSSVSKMGNVANNLNGLTKALESLSKLGNIKVSASIANQIGKIGRALSNLNVGDGATKIRDLVDALRPLETLGKSSLGTTVNALKKLPEALNKIDTRRLYSQIQSLTRIMQPLAEEMQKIANGFNAFPSRIQKLIRENEKLSTSNNKTSTSYVNLWAKCRMAYNVIKQGARIIANFIKSSNDYIENLNLFNASMGEYADEAQKYAEKVSEIMGIDPGEWMRNQGVFMTLATGFGVVGDRANKMSKNLTQLGYDLSSFFNISVEDAMLKLQSGLAGELEPLRRIGYDLSVARLQQEAYTLGINKKVAAMTQAEKAELRYHAIMTQVTTAQGDMARTLDAPANQLRILKAQVTMASRAIGNIFIPVLNKILPVAIAVIKVIRKLAESIAQLFGFELPEVDYSGLNGMASGAEDVASALDGASDSAKKLQQYTMGFDELNVIDPNKGSSGSGSGGVGGSGTGFDFELPEYDFLEGITESKVNDIFDKLQKRAGEVLTTVGLIGTGLLSWKIATTLIPSIMNLKNMLASPTLSKPLTITGGVILTVTGASIEFVGLQSAVQNGLDALNFAEIIGGGGLLVGGTAMLGSAIATATGTAIAGAIVTGIGAIIAGIPAMFVGIYDACMNGIGWLNSLLTVAGSAAAGAGIGAIIGSLGGPITAGIGALIGLAVGLIIDGFIFIAQHADDIVKFLTETIPKWFMSVDWESVGKTIGKLVVDTIGLIFSVGNFLALGMTLTRYFETLFGFEIDWGRVGYAIGQGIGVILKGIGELFKIGLKLITSVSIVDIVSAVFEIGWNIVKGLAKGFGSGFVDLVKDVLDLFGGLIRGIKDALGIHSPSTVFIEIAEFLVDGLWKGISDAWDKFVSDVKDLVDKFIKNVKEKLGITDSSSSTVFIDIAKKIVDGIWEGISNNWNKFVTDVKELVDSFIKKAKDTLGITGSSESTVFKDIAKNIVDGLVNGIKDKYTYCKDKVSEWTTSIKGWFTNDGGEGTIFDKFKGYGTSITSNLSDAIDNGVSLTFFEDVFGRINTAMSKLTSPLKKTINAIIGVIESMTNKVIDGINSMIGALNGMKFDIPEWAPVLGGKSFGLSIPSLKHVFIPRLMADGGMVNTGEMFIAREAGPEMVGSIGRRTAVANNDQIVSGIASGVAQANGESNALLREQNSLLRALLEKETGTYLDGKAISKSVERHQRERGRVLVTGGAY